MASRQRERLFATGPDPVRRLRREAERTIKALRDTGRLEAIDAGLVAAYRTTAEVADERRADPDAAFHLTQALKLFVEIDGRLRGLGDGDADDGWRALLDAAGAEGGAPSSDSPL